MGKVRIVAPTNSSRMAWGRNSPSGPTATARAAKAMAAVRLPVAKPCQQASPPKKSSQRPANWRRVREDGAKEISAHCMAVPSKLIELKLGQVLGPVCRINVVVQILLVEYKVFQHQNV